MFGIIAPSLSIKGFDNSWDVFVFGSSSEKEESEEDLSVDDWDLVNLLYLKSSHDSEILWLVSLYVLYVWETVHAKKLEVKRDKFFGYLTFKYKMHQVTAPDELLNLHHIYS